MAIDAIAELGASRGDAECERHVELKTEVRSTLHGEAYGPPPVPSMEKRYMLLSPRVRREAEALALQGQATAAAVLLCQFGMVASIFTAPFLMYILEAGLLYLSLIHI